MNLGAVSRLFLSKITPRYLTNSSDNLTPFKTDPCIGPVLYLWVKMTRLVFIGLPIIPSYHFWTISSVPCVSSRNISRKGRTRPNHQHIQLIWSYHWIPSAIWSLNTRGVEREDSILRATSILLYLFFYTFWSQRGCDLLIQHSPNPLNDFCWYLSERRQSRLLGVRCC